MRCSERPPAYRRYGSADHAFKTLSLAGAKSIFSESCGAISDPRAFLAARPPQFVRSRYAVAPAAPSPIGWKSDAQAWAAHSRISWFEGFTDPADSGRGINLFKSLRRHFRSVLCPARLGAPAAEKMLVLRGNGLPSREGPRPSCFGWSVGNGARPSGLASREANTWSSLPVGRRQNKSRTYPPCLVKEMLVSSGSRACLCLAEYPTLPLDRRDERAGQLCYAPATPT